MNWKHKFKRNLKRFDKTANSNPLRFVIGKIKFHIRWKDLN